MVLLKLRNEQQRKIRQGQEVEIYATASDNDDLVVSVLPVNGVALTLLRQPSFVGELKIVITDGGGGISDGDVLIVGRDTAGVAATETLDFSAGAGTYHTTAEWTYITSLTISSLAGDDANTRISVGTAPASGEDLDTPVLRDRWWAGLAEIAVGDQTNRGAAPPLADDWIVRGPENQLVVETEALIEGDAAVAPIVEESVDGGESVTGTFTDTAAANEHVQTVVTLTAPLYRFRWETSAEQTGKFDVSVRARRAP